MLPAPQFCSPASIILACPSPTNTPLLLSLRTTQDTLLYILSTPLDMARAAVDVERFAPHAHRRWNVRDALRVRQQALTTPCTGIHHHSTRLAGRCFHTSRCRGARDPSTIAIRGIYVWVIILYSLSCCRLLTNAHTWTGRLISTSANNAALAYASVLTPSRQNVFNSNLFSELLHVSRGEDAVSTQTRLEQHSTLFFLAAFLRRTAVNYLRRTDHYFPFRRALLCFVTTALPFLVSRVTILCTIAGASGLVGAWRRPG